MRHECGRDEGTDKVALAGEGNCESLESAHESTDTRSEVYITLDGHVSYSPRTWLYVSMDWRRKQDCFAQIFDSDKATAGHSNMRLLFLHDSLLR